MNEVPPQGSNIKINYINGYREITLPHGNGGIMRFFIGAFLLFWLGGWTMGFLSASEQVLSGKGGAFLIFWLAGWTLGGVFALYFLYRIFRGSVPEKLILKNSNLAYDSGVPPFKTNFSITSQKDFWKSFLFKRKQIEFTDDQLKTLQLRETNDGNRLTIDKGAERIDIAISVTEIEREWLHGFLKENYS